MKINYDGKEINVELTEEAWLTNRSFPENFHDADMGEEYIDEWCASARDTEGNEYQIIWHFSEIKGQETLEAENLPWDDIDKIYDVTLKVLQKAKGGE